MLPKITANGFVAAIIGIYVFLFVAVSANLGYTYLWFDEAGQFWISKGLNHYSDPFQAPQGLPDIIANNATYNLDPGGFSILLHYWAGLSNSSLWLRALPFLFFIGTIVSFAHLSYKLTENFKISLLMGFLPFLFSTIVSEGFEIRAYSMEYLGVVMAAVSIVSLRNKISNFRLFAWGLILSIFMTSRYSVAVVIFTTSLCVVYLIWTSNKRLQDKGLALFLYALPLFSTLAIIYYFSLSWQNPDLSELLYQPYLIDDWTLLYKPIQNLYYILIVGVMTCIWIYSMVRKSIFSKYQMLLFVSVASNLLFVVLSFMGKYPWSPVNKRGLPYAVITLLGFSFILGEILLRYLNNPSLVKRLSVLVAVLAVFYLCKDSLVRKTPENNFLQCLGNIDYENVNRVFVDRWGDPEVRYLFEYGFLKPIQPGIYPGHFTFQNFVKYTESNLSFGEWYQSLPKMNDLLEYDLLITPELAKYGNNNKWTLLPGCEAGVYVQK